MHRSMLILSIFAVLTLAASPNSSITGRASVIDGDTLELAGERIRLHGVDAPESWQTCQDGGGKVYRCGKASAEALDAFLAASRPLTCRRVDRDRYGRAVARCKRMDGEDVAALMVRAGHALDWPKYSRGEYALEERGARDGRRGMWAGKFMAPWVARKERQ